MKKTLFYVTMAMALLASCSNEVVDDMASDGDNVAIALGLASPTVKVGTRGTGTVGDVEGTNNVWHGQPIYVIMTDADFQYAKSGATFNGQTNAEIYPNTEFIAPGGDNKFVPTSAQGAVERADAFDHQIKYYPHTGTFNFFAYAMGRTPGNVPTVTQGPDAYTVPVKIDGSQDLMTAVAPTNEDIDGVESSKLYSAASARKGVQPTLTFHHELARFTFYVKAGNDNALGGKDERGEYKTDQAVRITKVVLKSKTSGKMVVARPSATRETSNIVWTAGQAKEELQLKQRNTNVENPWITNLEALEENKLASTEIYQQVGNESLLVAPNEEEYDGYIEIVQKLATYDEHVADPQYTDAKNTFYFKLKASDVKKTVDGNPVTVTSFEPGMAYNVNLIVYGSEIIIADTQLTAWVTGGNIEIDPDK